MPDDLEPEDLETPDPEPQGAARRVQQKQDTAAQRELAVYKAGLGDLNDDQRQALLAVAKDDLSPDVLKAKATALGFVKEPEPPAPSEQDRADGAALGNAAAAAAGANAAAPPTVGAEAIKAVYDRAQRIANPAELAKLQPELMAAIAGAGLNTGSIEHNGTFEPIS